MARDCYLSVALMEEGGDLDGNGHVTGGGMDALASRTPGSEMPRTQKWPPK